MSRDTRGTDKQHYRRLSEFTPSKQHQFSMGNTNWTLIFWVRNLHMSAVRYNILLSHINVDRYTDQLHLQ